MFWITKSFEYGAAWSADQDIFVALQMIVAAEGSHNYRKMIMAISSDDETDTVYIGGPRQNLTAAFPDYKLVTGALPVMTSILVADQSEWPNHISIKDFAA